MSRITRHGAPARLGATTTAAAALLVLLAGCSSAGTDSGSDADTIDTAAATGDTITGDGYSYSVPEGWGTPDADPASMGADTLAADLTDTDGFADNVNVVLSPAGEVSAEQVEGAGVTELENAGAMTMVRAPRARISWMLLTTFLCRSWGVSGPGTTMKTGWPASMRAMGPCLSSPAANPSAWM